MTGPPAETRSGFTLEAFQTRVIEDGLAAAIADYTGDTEHRRQMREGAVAGFEACRLKTPAELALLLRDARARERQALFNNAPDTWWHKCYVGEVEWVCNCLSAVLQQHGWPGPRGTPPLDLAALWEQSARYSMDAQIDIETLLDYCRALRAALEESQEALMNLRTWNTSMHGSAPLAPAGRAIERAAAVLAAAQDGPAA